MIKETIIPVTDPAEIASIKSDDFGAIIGMQDDTGNWWAYKFSVIDWRERQGIREVDPLE